MLQQKNLLAKYKNLQYKLSKAKSYLFSSPGLNHSVLKKHEHL